MTREDIENNVGYWQEKANLEYIKQRQEHGVNDPYMIIEIDEAFDAGFDKGYQYALQHPHWIPVEEELPPASCGVISDPVLVFIGNNKGWSGYIREGFYNHAAKEWSYMNRGRTHKVTHWMEIQPPRKEE